MYSHRLIGTVRWALSGPICAVAVLLMTGLAPCWAEDFVINVPVDVSDMEPDVQQVQVSCYVHATENEDGERIGVGIGVAPIATTGEFNGVVRVPIDALPGRDVNRAQGFVCTLMFSNGLSMETERDRGTQGAQVKPGTSPTLQIRGALPRR